MLVVSRNIDQTIVIGETIKIMIVDIRGDNVRIGIEAPAEISIHRQEVYDAIQRENAARREAKDVKPAKQITTKTKGEND